MYHNQYLLYQITNTMEIAVYNNPKAPVTNYRNQEYAVQLKEINLKDILLILLIILAFLNSIDTPSPLLGDYNHQQSITDNEFATYEEQASIFIHTVNRPTDKITESNFLEHRHLLISKHLIENGVSSLCFLDEHQTLSIHQEIAVKFNKYIKGLNKLSNSQSTFLDQELISTVLQMQQKYQIPASVLLSKAIIASDWGKRVYKNNLFQITSDYDLKDYASKKASFEDFSLQLTNNPQYTSLFVGGKDYQNWTKKMGTIICNDNIFSASPDCYNQMEDIIKAYNLDLLDF